MLTFSDLDINIKNCFNANKTVSVAFVKKTDGSVRHMAFRRNLKAYQKSTATKTDKQTNVLQNNNMMLGWDTNVYIQTLKATGDNKTAASKSYRMFPLENVLAFMCGGKVVDYRDENEILKRFGEDIYSSLTKGMVSAMKDDTSQSNNVDAIIDASQETLNQETNIQSENKKIKISRKNLNRLVEFAVKRALLVI